MSTITIRSSLDRPEPEPPDDALPALLAWAFRNGQGEALDGRDVTSTADVLTFVGAVLSGRTLRAGDELELDEDALEALGDVVYLIGQDLGG